MNKSKNTLQVKTCVCDAVMLILVINWLHLELTKTLEMDIPTYEAFFPLLGKPSEVGRPTFNILR